MRWSEASLGKGEGVEKFQLFKTNADFEILYHLRMKFFEVPGDRYYPKSSFWLMNEQLTPFY